MADNQTSLLTIKIDVPKGAVDVKQLTASLRRSPDFSNVRVAVRSAEQKAQKSLEKHTRSLGERLGEGFGRHILGPTIRAPFDALAATARFGASTLLKLSGAIGTLAVAAGPFAIVIGGFAIALAGLAVTVSTFAVGILLLRKSFGWAQEQADSQMKVAARAKRMFPLAIGKGVEQAEKKTKIELDKADILFGGAADSMTEQITRRFTEFRMGKGIRGDADIFKRWGITPDAVKEFEDTQGGAAISLTQWLDLWIRQKEDFDERQRKAGKGSAAEQAIIRKRALMFDDITKLHNQKFADMVGALTSNDMMRLKEQLEKIAPLGHVEDATRKSIDFNIALWTFQANISEIAQGIGGDVQPKLTQLFDQITEKLTEKGMGKALRDLASAVSKQSWQAVTILVKQIDVQGIKNWFKSLGEWKPKEMAEDIKSFAAVMEKFGVGLQKFVATLIMITRRVIDILNWFRWFSGDAPLAKPEIPEFALGKRIFSDVSNVDLLQAVRENPELAKRAQEGDEAAQKALYEKAKEIGAKKAGKTDIAPGAQKDLLDAISRAEGTTMRGYNEVLGAGRYGRPDQPLTEMTLAEVYAAGRMILRRHGSSSAMGRYQITGSTMIVAARNLGYDWYTTKFTPAVQDAMAQEIARRQGLGAWEGLKHRPQEYWRAYHAMRRGGAAVAVPRLPMPAPPPPKTVEQPSPLLDQYKRQAPKIERENSEFLEAAKKAFKQGVEGSNILIDLEEERRKRRRALEKATSGGG